MLVRANKEKRELPSKRDEFSHQVHLEREKRKQRKIFHLANDEAEE